MSISRVHAALVHGLNDDVYLFDLGSTNGSFIDEKRVRPFYGTKISDGTVLSFGGSTRTYTLKVR